MLMKKSSHKLSKIFLRFNFDLKFYPKLEMNIINFDKKFYKIGGNRHQN